MSWLSGLKHSKIEVQLIINFCKKYYFRKNIFAKKKYFRKNIFTYSPDDDVRGHGERGDGGNPGEEAEDDETHPVQNHGRELPITLSAESRE